MDNCKFTEDARVHRKQLTVFAAILYTVFCGLLAVSVAFYINKEISLKTFVLLDIMATCGPLFMAVYLTWGLASKYLKYYIFINDIDIRFYADKMEQNYRVYELKSFEVTKRRGRFVYYKLKFSDGKEFAVLSVKPVEFETALRSILNI